MVGYVRDGELDIPVEPGDYIVTVHRGVRFEPVQQAITIESGQTTALTVKSGQDLRLDTTGDVNWTSGNATSNTVVSVKGASTQSWTAGLMSPPGGTFTITATSAKDASKSAKLTVTVTPPTTERGARQRPCRPPGVSREPTPSRFTCATWTGERPWCSTKCR